MINFRDWDREDFLITLFFSIIPLLLFGLIPISIYCGNLEKKNRFNKCKKHHTYKECYNLIYKD